MMGGIDLKVPESWTRRDQRDAVHRRGDRPEARAGVRRREGPPKMLTVSGFVFMGGVEVKH